MQYAQDRKQFGKPLIAFPRVSGKLAMMAVEIMIARQLTYFSRGKRTRPALRPRGRHGQAAGRPRGLGLRRQRAADPWRQRLRAGIPDFSRILCDARILNIFEGAAEIQAQVIARRLLG
jgi:(2S)-methylsuccinyl-CoA dehydrogenase